MVGIKHCLWSNLDMYVHLGSTPCSLPNEALKNLYILDQRNLKSL